MAAAGLEARYRRLLRWYPAEHRAVHSDEMLGVLMAAAQPGRSRPGLSESADLMASAARIRLRPGRALSDRDGWRDTLAVFSLIGPVLILGATIIAWLGGLAWSYLGHGAGLSLQLDVPDGAYENLQSAYPAAATVMWLLLVSQGIVAVLALAGLRRCAAVAAALYVLYFGTYLVIESTFPGAYLGIEVLMPLLLVAPLTTLVALLASAGPRRGRELMRRRQWVGLAAGLAAAAVLIRQLYIWPQFGRTIGPLLANLLGAAAAAAVALALALAWLSSAHGKRLAVLFGVPGCWALLEVAGQYLNSPASFFTGRVLRPTAELLVLCALAAMVYRTWRRGKSAAGGPSDGAA